MAGAKSRSGGRSKCRRFTNNQYTKSCSSSSSSAKKLKLDSPSKQDDIFQNTDASFHGYRFFDLGILFQELESCLSCKTCGGSVKFSEASGYGLVSKMEIECESCGLLNSFFNSKVIGEKNVHEINRRAVYAMRCIGRGLAGLKTFCGVMDLPAPITSKPYNTIMKHIKTATKMVAEESMCKAAEEEKKLTTVTGGVCVSGDGTWKTRGHSSLIGVCTLIGVETRKVIDVEILSSYCKGCAQWKGVKCGARYDQWKAAHLQNCTRNHVGSSAKMEVCGMVRMFSRSEDTRNARYIQYIGDGDTKTFLEIKKLEPYGPDVNIEKRECVGHVKKRMGTRLRKLKSESRGKKLRDGKLLGGKGRLTDVIIDKFSLYYGNAVRGNKDCVNSMRKAVWAIYYHTRSTDEEPLHTFCPKGASSWCKYQQAVAEGTEKSFSHQSSVPGAVMDEVKKVFKDLSNPELLKRCVGGHTQNPNESLNSIIWTFCPKNSGSGLLTAEVATYEAVVSYNEGSQGRLMIMNKLGVHPGANALEAARKSDVERVKQAEKQFHGMTLEGRRAKRASNALKAQKDLESEGVIYAAGAF